MVNKRRISGQDVHVGSKKMGVVDRTRKGSEKGKVVRRGRPRRVAQEKVIQVCEDSGAVETPNHHRGGSQRKTNFTGKGEKELAGQKAKTPLSRDQAQFPQSENGMAASKGKKKKTPPGE